MADTPSDKKPGPLLERVLRSRGVLIAGALLLVAFGLELLRQGGFVPEGGVEDVVTSTSN